MMCKQKPTSLSGAPEVDCEYRVGLSLHFAIASIGQDDTAVTFFRVDWDGDYYASVGGYHGCVIKPGKTRGKTTLLDVAFVSPIARPLSASSSAPTA